MRYSVHYYKIGFVLDNLAYLQATVSVLSIFQKGQALLFGISGVISVFLTYNGFTRGNPFRNQETSVGTWLLCPEKSTFVCSQLSCPQDPHKEAGPTFLAGGHCQSSQPPAVR